MPLEGYPQDDKTRKNNAPGAHYNEGAPPGHWRPQHKRIIGLAAIQPIQAKNNAPFATTTVSPVVRGQSGDIEQIDSMDQIKLDVERKPSAMNDYTRKINRKRLNQFN
jgi:hypothetical protein